MDFLKRKGNDMPETNNYTKEQVLEALENAPLITEEDIRTMKSSTKEKIQALQKNGVSGMKSLWLLTKYRNEEYPNLIADMTVSYGMEANNIDAAIVKYIPHDGCFTLACEVFGEDGSNMFLGTERLLQEEIMKGNIRKIYPAEREDT